MSTDKNNNLSGTIEIEVLLFSVLKEKVGQSKLKVSLDATSLVTGSVATGETLIAYMIDQYPEIAPWKTVVRLAINETYRPAGTELSAGDVVAFITPVSGG